MKQVGGDIIPFLVARKFVRYAFSGCEFANIVIKNRIKMSFHSLVSLFDILSQMIYMVDNIRDIEVPFNVIANGLFAD